MTTPATKTTARSKETAKPTETVPDENVAIEDNATESPIPAALANEPILAEFCNRYLEVFNEISKYNKEVLAEKDAEWNPAKVMEQAKKFASPENAADQDKAIKAALDELEKAENARLLARKAVLEMTSNKLGISLVSTVERNPETEAPLKEKRKFAIEIGSQLSTIAGMTNNKEASSAVIEFLAKNPMPAIGRDQVRVFGSDGKSTPKYRVKVEVIKDGNVLLSEDGFTKTALSLSKPVFGYERGKSLKADVLREVWEKALANDKDTTSTEFTDNGLTYVITKK